MLAELRSKSQVTIPKELVEKLGLAEGDMFDVVEKDGSICFIPVAVYPRKYLDKLQEEIAETKNKIASGKKPVFDDIDLLLKKLERKNWYNASLHLHPGLRNTINY